MGTIEKKRTLIHRATFEEFLPAECCHDPSTANRKSRDFPVGMTGGLGSQGETHDGAAEIFRTAQGTLLRVRKSLRLG